MCVACSNIQNIEKTQLFPEVMKETFQAYLGDKNRDFEKHFRNLNAVAVTSKQNPDIGERAI